MSDDKVLVRPRSIAGRVADPTVLVRPRFCHGFGPFVKCAGTRRALLLFRFWILDFDIDFRFFGTGGGGGVFDPDR